MMSFVKCLVLFSFVDPTSTVVDGLGEGRLSLAIRNDTKRPNLGPAVNVFPVYRYTQILFSSFQVEYYIQISPDEHTQRRKFIFFALNGHFCGFDNGEVMVSPYLFLAKRVTLPLQNLEV